MKRVLTFVAIVVLLPMAVAAQVPPPPPPVPPTPVIAPPVPPVPAPAPLPVPRPMVAPVMEPWHFEYAQEAARAAREMERVNADAAREAARATREVRAQLEREGLMAAPVPFDFHWDHMDFQPFAQEGGTYSAGLSQLYARQYEKAIASFDRAVAQKSPRADGALYWKAFSFFKLGRRDDALAAIAQLRRDYPKSPYLKDASVLEADVKQTRPEDIQDNDEIKVLAINALQESDAERAVPLLEGVLNRNNSLRVKRSALNVLTRFTNNPRARQILLSYAKGTGTPDLQMEAIKLLAVNRDNKTTSAELRQIYESTEDVAVKRAVISAYQSSGNKDALVQIAQTSGAPVVVRQQAISGLTNIAAPQELWALYQKETDRTLRLQMVSAFGSMGALEQLTQVLKTEKDPEVRRRALRSLGNMKSDKTGPMLVDLYASETDLDNRRAVINALSSQHNAEALVAIARKETNIPLKTEIVRQLNELARSSAPGAKIAMDYLQEILK
jgi:HEAT repeat protein